MDSFVEALRAPEAEYRPRNYWGWLENITPDEVVWQIRRMHEVGLGGYVMHARGGLTMPYMGDQWIASVKAMIEEGRKLGMVTIVDDEHGWPSGFGAGKVNGLGEQYQLKYLLCEELPASQIQVDRFTLGVWRRDSFKPVQSPCTLPADTLLVRVYYKLDPYYVDNMDAKVVRAFIDASYEDYKANVGDSFGDGLYGIFSDEPQTARYATPWSLILPELFEKRFGYSLPDKLHCVFYESEGYEKLRYDLFTLMQDCFALNYAKQIYDWCDSNKLAFTGHTCIEEEFYGQIRCAIGTMPFYEYMHVPGIDWLGRTALSNLLILQLSSVAAQTGKKRALSEMYGCAGWNVSLEELKWIAQWQAVLGINDQLQHLGLYSLSGSRKREYPASLFYQQPWFDEYKPYNDYFARIDKLISGSQLELDLLLLHPIKSAWTLYNGQNSDAVDALQAKFDQLTNDLLALNACIHYGDETIMHRHGRVENGRLWVGEMSYHTVMLPTMLTLDASTCTLLEDFIASGGRVLLAGNAPTMLEGVPSTRVAALARRFDKVSPTREALLQALNPPARIQPLEGENNLVYLCRRSYMGRKFYYIVNNDLEHGCDFSLLTNSNVALCKYDPLNGTLDKQAFDCKHMHLGGAEALVLVETHDAQPAVSPEKNAVLPYSVQLDGIYDFVRCLDNALTLDRCQLSFDGDVYQPECNLLTIQQQLISEAINRDVYLKFHFFVDELVQAPIQLVMEQPELHTILLNGKPVCNKATGWVVDKCMKTLPVEVQLGENELVLKRKFENPDRVYLIKNDPDMHEAESNRVTVQTELESVYLWGQFSVVNRAKQHDGPRRTTCTRGDFRLAALPSSIDIARTEQHGFPFMAGKIVLERKFTLDHTPDRAIIKMNRPDAIITAIEVNHAALPSFLWAPYMAEVDGLKVGENTLRITLTGSNRNLLGPHHNNQGESYGVGPYSFPPQTEDTYLVRFGIEGGVEIHYN